MVRENLNNLTSLMCRSLWFHMVPYGPSLSLFSSRDDASAGERSKLSHSWRCCNRKAANSWQIIALARTHGTHTVPAR